MSLESLNQHLLEAHEAGDITALVDLYQQAGKLMSDKGDIDAGCFYLTHAYISALEVGAPAAKDIHQILIDYGREE